MLINFSNKSFVVFIIVLLLYLKEYLIIFKEIYVNSTINHELFHWNKLEI